jgi:predicted deacylase
MKSFKKNAILLFLITITFLAQAQQKTFIFMNQSVAPGTKKSFMIPIVNGQDSTFIPVTVYHGKSAGKVLGITAGVHGYEYPPIIAAQALGKYLEPAKMNGTVLLVHIANVEGFLGKRLQVNPMDNKNLNRVFPGSENGTITEKIAFAISNQIINRCDYFLDIHAGDANSELRPYSGYYNYTDVAKLSAEGRAMAMALGFDYIIQFGNEQKVPVQSIYCSREAIRQNIPAIDIECGGFGQAGPLETNYIVDAVKGLFSYLKIQEGPLLTKSNHVFIKNRADVSSLHTGIFYTKVKAGDYIKKGMQLGYVTDFFGKHLSDVIAPTDGVVLYMTNTPPVKKDEHLFNIGMIE